MHIVKRGGFSQVSKLGLAGFFTSLGIAAVTTIWAVYLESYLHNASYVGFVTAFFMIVGVVAYIFWVPFIEKHKKTKVYSFILLLFALFYVLFSMISNIFLIILLGIAVSVIGSLRISLYGIIIRDKTRDTSVSKNEGFIYTVLNLAFFVAPILAGYIASNLGINFVFLFGAATIFISFVLMNFFGIQDNRVKKKIDKKPHRIFLDFFKKKKRVISYILSGGRDFWWVLIYIYIPIYIFDAGLGEEIIGYFLGAVVIPLILVEYSVGKYVGKRGFKKVFFFGYLILAVSAFICFFVSNIYVILIILSLASFGAGMVESTTESYFLDIITKEERDKFYPAYNTTIGISSFFSRALGAVVLLIFPFKFIFILFGVFMLGVSFFSFKAKNIVEETRVKFKNKKALVH